MLNIATCDECVHENVCGKRNMYERLAKAADRLYVRADSSAVDLDDVTYVKDCDDVVVDVRCKYLKYDTKVHTRSVFDWEANVSTRGET